MNHGVYVTQQGTSVSTPVVAESGVPFVVGVAPVQSAESPAAVGVPVLCASWDEAKEKLGYSDDWDKYSLCEFMYSHFKIFACQPVIFVNVLDPATDKSSVAAADIDVVNHQVKLPIEAIDSAALVVKGAGGLGTAYTKDTDYSVFYDGEYCIVELLSASTHYAETSLNIAYDKVTPASIVANDIVTAIESVELCLTTLGIVPDLICAPKWSKTSTVAAAMAAKAGAINGLFHAKAVIDIDCSAGGATSYSAAVTKKSTDGMTDVDEIVCWPMATLGDKKFHLSSIVAGRMAATDTERGGNPSESPSNKAAGIDGLCLESGAAVNNTLQQANVLNAGGIVTALNFVNGWVVWGNYTACWPASSDVKDYFIPVARTFAWIGNCLIKTFWSKLDAPMNRRLIDNIVDSANIWMNGLVGQGILLGGRVEMIDAENPITSLMAGIIKLHVYATPPSPMQELDFVLEYDASYVETALQS